MPCVDAYGLLPGRGAPGRCIPWALAKGLLPGRAVPGRGMPDPSADGAEGVATAGAAGVSTIGAAGAAGAGVGVVGASATGAGRGGAAGAAGFSGALMPSAARAARNLRATGGSMLEDGPLTNSPISLSFSRAFLLSMPSSAAISCTRGFATVFSLSGRLPIRRRP
jgi:hypothetical protein